MMMTVHDILEIVICRCTVKRTRDRIVCMVCVSEANDFFGSSGGGTDYLGILGRGRFGGGPGQGGY